MFEFDPTRPPPAPLDAATVVVARNGTSGLEIFCVKRHGKSGFLGGAVVFPGGKVDETDKHPAWEQRTTALLGRARAFDTAIASGRIYAIAALRECLEEAAILPVAGGSLDARAANQLRSELPTSASELPPLARALAGRGLTLDLGQLHALARWITPVAERRRYDTRFYLLPLPEGQIGCHDEQETIGSFWATPVDILSRWEAGEILLAPPTSRTLQILSAAPTVDSAIRLATTLTLQPICPNFAVDGSRMILTLPGDPLHPVAADEPPPPDAPTRFVMQHGRFVACRATRKN